MTPGTHSPQHGGGGGERHTRCGGRTARLLHHEMLRLQRKAGEQMKRTFNQPGNLAKTKEGSLAVLP